MSVVLGVTRVLFPQSVRWYVGQLEKTVIALCGRFGVEAATSPHTGVWVGDNKICAIGTTQPNFIVYFCKCYFVFHKLIDSFIGFVLHIFLMGLLAFSRRGLGPPRPP